MVMEQHMSSEPKAVGIAGTMPGTSGFTMACFNAAVVPVGTILYDEQALSALRAEVEALRKERDECCDAGYALNEEFNAYQRMFEASCIALAKVAAALGCDPQDGGAEPILTAIDEIRADLEGNQSAMLHLRSEVKALRRDAERYRWLRKQDNDDYSFSVVKNPHFDVFDVNELDRSIDAAMENPA